MKVYVSTYGKYSSGSLAGEWVNVKDFSDHDEFIEHCKNIHSDENDPEFMFQDWEDIPDVLVSETNIEDVVFEIIKKDIDTNAFFAFVKSYGYCDDLSIFEDAFYGDYSEESRPRIAFAKNYIEETGILDGIPENLKYYFDVEQFSRDLFLTDFYEIDGYIFLNI